MTPFLSPRIEWPSDVCRKEWLRFHFLRVAQTEVPEVLTDLKSLQSRFDQALEANWGDWDPWNAPLSRLPDPFLEEINIWAHRFHMEGQQENGQEDGWVTSWAIRTLFWWSLPSGRKTLTWANPTTYPRVELEVAAPESREPTERLPTRKPMLRIQNATVGFTPGRETLSQVGREIGSHFDEEMVRSILLSLDKEFVNCFQELGGMRRAELLHQFVQYQVGQRSLNSILGGNEDSSTLRRDLERWANALGLKRRIGKPGRPKRAAQTSAG